MRTIRTVVEIMVQQPSQPGYEFSKEITDRITQVKEEHPGAKCKLKFTTSQSGRQTCNMVWSISNQDEMCDHQG